MTRSATTAPRRRVHKSPPEVLTLEEAAAYLRVSEAEVVVLATKHGLPGRKIRDDWRFHKLGLVHWLLGPSPKDRLLSHAGAMADDPDLEAMLEKIYQERGRPMVEEAE
jgi:excisionase family DNA binding protein